MEIFNKQTKNPTSPLHIDDSLRYINYGHNEMVELVGISTNNPKSTKYRIKFLPVNTKSVTKEFLKSSIVPDIASIPISEEDYTNKSKISHKKKIDNIMFPEVLSPLQQTFKSCNDRLHPLHTK